MQIKLTIILLFFFFSSCVVTNKFLKPASDASDKDVLKLEEVATSIASKEAPLHASPTNSSWEIFLVIMLVVAGACAFAKHDTIKLKAISIWEWLTKRYREIREKLDK